MQSTAAHWVANKPTSRNLFSHLNEEKGFFSQPFLESLFWNLIVGIEKVLSRYGLYEEHVYPWSLAVKLRVNHKDLGITCE